MTDTALSMTTNFSSLLMNMGGSFLEQASSPQELQSRLDMVVTAWNLSLQDKTDRQQQLKRLIRKQKGNAPSKDAWKALETQIKSLIKRKLERYPGENTELVRAEAVFKGQSSYDIQVYFKDEAEQKKLEEAQLKVTNFNKLMSKE